MKNFKWVKWVFAFLVLIIIAGFGFTFTVKEGSCSIVTRFGEVRTVEQESGLHFKLPWPFEKVITYDTRSQYLDSGYLETLTQDKKNIILQTYIVWHIEDPLRYFVSVGDASVAEKYINDLVTNVKNGVMGNYPLTALVSTDGTQLKIEEIQNSILEETSAHTVEQYGIQIDSIKIKRLSLPSANVDSVFEQMTAERSKYAVQLLAEGERDAAIITSEADTEAAKIVAEGKEQAAEIEAETERQVSALYAEAYAKNPTLFTFLKKLIALENSVNENTVLITKSDGTLFEVLEK